MPPGDHNERGYAGDPRGKSGPLSPTLEARGRPVMTYRLYGAPSSLYTAKPRSYLVKQGVAFENRAAGEARFREPILPRIHRWIISVLETPTASWSRTARTSSLVAGLVAALSVAASCEARAKPGLPEGLELSRAVQAGTVFFRNPKLDASSYTAIYVEPASVDDEAGTVYKNVSEADKKDVAAFLTAEFTRVIGERHALASAPGPGVMLMKITLTGAEGSRSVASTALRLTPFGAAMSVVKSAAKMPATFTGSVTFAAELRDGGTGELMGAFSTHQSPPAINLTSGLGKLTAARLGCTQAAEAFVKAVARARAR